MLEQLRNAGWVSEKDAEKRRAKQLSREAEEKCEMLRLAGRGLRAEALILDYGASIADILDRTQEMLVDDPNQIHPILKALHSLPENDETRRHLVPFFLELRKALHGNAKLHERKPIIERAYADAAMTGDATATGKPAVA